MQGLARPTTALRPTFGCKEEEGPATREGVTAARGFMLVDVEGGHFLKLMMWDVEENG